jgi:L-tyrosine isonitrile synthase
MIGIGIAEQSCRSHVNKRAPQAPLVPNIIQSFNTWAFKREQPCRPQLLNAAVAQAVGQSKPIDFVLYWGKGPRSSIAEPERQCLGFLASLRSRVRDVYAPGVAMNLVLTDTHATLNGHSPESIAAYFADVRQQAAEWGFQCHLLGKLTKLAGPFLQDVDDSVAPETLLPLVESAARWYRGEGTPLDGALKYYHMNMVEKRVIAQAFPQAVFVTFNGSNQRALFPDTLPIFYMYSTKRGTAVKPWFQAAGDAPALAKSA